MAPLPLNAPKDYFAAEMSNVKRGFLDPVETLKNYSSLFPSGSKENLAGKQDSGNANVLKSLIKGGTVTLNINAPSGVVKDYDDTQSTGVKVNLGSTTGQKSYKNGY